MSAQHKARTKADDEAESWIARLGTRTIPLETVEEFARWRSDPTNAEAYHRAEQLWSTAGALSDDPDIKAALSNAETRRPSRIRPREATVLGLTAVLAASLAICIFVWQGRGVYQTDVGELRVFQLTDGSRVRLDTDSRLRVRMSDGRRSVELIEGQAMFEVAHDPARPFVVSTTDASITAVGTVFEVRRIGEETKVVLLAGAIDVDKAGTESAPERLQPNQQSAISRGASRVTTVDAAAVTSWTTGNLVFVDTPLAEAVAEMNRYLTDPIILDAPSVAGTSINGVFRSGDRAAFVSAASHLLSLRAVSEPDGSVKLVERVRPAD